MFVYFGILLILVASVLSDTIDNNLGEDSYESNEFLEDDTNRHTKNGSRLIFPGTKWCGPGNNADDDNDLGHYQETDKCCRAHDHCDGIEAGGSKYGLENKSSFSKLHCGCDRAFYKCLKNIDEPQATTIGELYFFANEMCYKKAHPIIDCESYVNFLWMRRCAKYRVDVTRPKIYQFFDLPFYDTIDGTLSMRRSAAGCDYRSLVHMMNRK